MYKAQREDKDGWIGWLDGKSAEEHEQERKEVNEIIRELGGEVRSVDSRILGDGEYVGRKF